MTISTACTLFFQVAGASALVALEAELHILSGEEVAIDLAQDFCTLVRARQADRFDDWLARAMVSAVGPLQRFAAGLRVDYQAVKADIRLLWSIGPVEGQINRWKMLKRSMFGRAKLDLLSRRFLLAA